MHEVYIYAGKDQSLDGMGICGALTPTSCIHDEQAGGMSEVTLEHPFDELGKWRTIRTGRILKCWVPVRETPQLRLDGAQTEQTTITRQVYRVRTQGSRLHLRQQPSTSSRILGRYNPGDEVVKLEDAGSADGHAWYKVAVSKDGATGYMAATYLEYVRSYTETVTGSADATLESSDEAARVNWTVRPQLFQIGSVTADENGITASAQHISYRLLKNLTTFAPEGEVTLQTALNGILDSCETEHNFRAYTDINDRHGEISWKAINPIKAMLDAETGALKRWNAQLIRDNWDLFFLRRAGGNRGVRIESGKNLIGVSCSEDMSGVATRIKPVGKNQDGTDLLLPELYVDSPLIDAYDEPMIYVLQCADCKVGTDGLTVDTAYARMREQAQAMIDGGCDRPVKSIKVDFLLLGDSEETAQYRELDKLFLYDSVAIADTYIDETAEVVALSWDCLNDRPVGIEVGSVAASMSGAQVASWQIPSGISGGKLTQGSVGAQQIGDDVISARHIQASSINAEAIQAEAVTAEAIAAGAVTAGKIEAGAVTAQAIAAEAVTTEKLAAKSVTAEKIAAGAISADQIAAGGITAGNIASGTITAEQLMAGLITADSGLIAVGAIQTAQIADGSITSAKIVSLNADVINAGTLSVERLVLVGEDGIVYHINASSAGLTAAQLQDETYQHYLNGTVIVAKSITAEQIAAESITGNEIAANTITAGKLNVSEIFANAATIAALNAYDITGNEYLRLFVPAQAGSVVSGSTVLINGEQFRVITPKAVFAILSEDSPDGEELLSIDENGVSGRTAAFDELRSPTVLQATAAAKHTPATGGELSAILAEIGGTYLKGDVSIDASAVSGGRLSLRGLMGGGRLLITGGTFTGVSIADCTALVRFEGSVFTSAGTAITLDNARLVLARCAFSAKQGLAMMRDADAVLGSCTGACTTLATLNGGSELRITGDSLPYGVLPDGVDGEIYSPYPFIPAPEEPEAEAETEIALTATASRTWDNGWLSTSVYGSAVYQGAVNGGALRRGCIWFDRSAISGKEILSATLSVRRMTGFGGGGAVEVGIYGTSAASAIGTPAIGTKYASASIAREETKVIDVTEAVKAYAAGRISGLMLYSAQTGTFSGKSYTYGYSKFYGSGDANAPVLTVRYKG